MENKLSLPKNTKNKKRIKSRNSQLIYGQSLKLKVLSTELSFHA